jgi:hypothetical protein
MKKLRFKIVQLVAMVGLLIAGIGVSVALASNGNSPNQTTSTTTTTTTTSQCSRAHPCSPEVCEEVGAHGDDCLPPETTTTTPETTTTTPCDEVESEGNDCGPPETTTTTPPPSGCGVAGKDGEPGNDDCATSTTTPTTSSTSTTTPTTTTTATTTTTVVQGTTTTSESSGAAPGSVAKPKQGVKGQVASATAGELPFTGFPAWILAIAGSMLLLSGLGMRRFAKQHHVD